MSLEFIARNGIIAQKDSIITGSLTVTRGISGSFFGTASNAVSSSYSLSSSFAVSSSYALSASYAVSASYALSSSYAVTSSFSITGSFALNVDGGGF
tara:strand:- start:666 stop:956 length:291 start_codon:yes stop_codon:yes gene_type:complete